MASSTLHSSLRGNAFQYGTIALNSVPAVHSVCLLGRTGQTIAHSVRNAARYTLAIIFFYFLKVRSRVPNSPTGQVLETRPDGQSKLMSVTRPGQ